MSEPTHRTRQSRPKPHTSYACMMPILAWRGRGKRTPHATLGFAIGGGTRGDTRGQHPSATTVAVLVFLFLCVRARNFSGCVGTPRSHSSMRILDRVRLTTRQRMFIALGGLRIVRMGLRSRSHTTPATLKSGLVFSMQPHLVYEPSAIRQPLRGRDTKPAVQLIEGIESSV